MKSSVVRHLGSSVGLVTVRASIQLMHDHAGDAVAERGDGAGIVARRPGWLWRRLLLGSGVVAVWLCDQGGNEGAEQRFAPPAGVVDELKEAKVGGQLLLRDAAVRAQPGAQQRPEALQRIDVNLAEAVAILVPGIFAAAMADRSVLVAPSRQAGIDRILVRVDA